MNRYKTLAILLIAIALLVFSSQVDFDVNAWVQWLQLSVEKNYILAASSFFIVYVIVAALNLPGSGALTLAGGITFGFLNGLLFVSFASSLGATLSMLLARTFFRDWVQRKFSSFSYSVNKGIDENGASYLFTLRMIPIVPFFVVNPVFGLTRMPIWQFYVVSQIGMLPVTAIYVNLGATVGDLEQITLASIFTPDIILAFALLVAFPFVVKRLYKQIKTQLTLRGYKKPKIFDANLIVIGAGAAGLVSAYIAAAIKAKVILIEKHRMGGDCLNTGCVPSKALIRSAKAAQHVREAEQFGVKVAQAEIDFKAVMDRVRRVVQTVEPHDSVARYESLGVNCVSGEAKILSPYQVEVDGKILSARKIIVAAGAQPRVPNIPGINRIPYLTSDNLWGINELPQKLLVLGGGPIGCELAQAFSRLGATVLLVERGNRLIPRADGCVSDFIFEKFKTEGVSVYLNTDVNEFETKNDKFVAHCRQRHTDENVPVAFEFDQVLLATGRVANTEQTLFEKLEFKKNNNGTLKVDSHLQTSIPGIYACGDIVGPYQFTHAASHQAWYASVNALLGGLKKFKVNYDTLPWVIFTDPEIAHVGATESELKEKGRAYEATEYDLGDLDRAIAESESGGFVRVFTKKGSDKILGATIIGSRAGEMINAFSYAKKNKRGLNSILGTIHSYPTYSEASKLAAGQWKNAHKPQAVLNCMAWIFKIWRK